MFVETVARNRSIDAGDVQKTEAGVFFGDNSIPMLADEQGTFEDAMQALMQKIEGQAKNANAGSPLPAPGKNKPKGEDLMPAIPGISCGVGRGTRSTSNETTQGRRPD